MCYSRNEKTTSGSDNLGGKVERERKREREGERETERERVTSKKGMKDCFSVNGGYGDEKRGSWDSR